jgi:uncharacterized Fe-S cluster-containing MiaB family protein
MKNEIDKSLEIILKKSINAYLNEQQFESEFEKIQNQPPEYNVYAMMKLLNRHRELKKEFMNYKQLYGRRNSNIKASEIIFRNYILNDPAFEREYRKILDDFQGKTTEKLPPIRK